MSDKKFSLTNFKGSDIVLGVNSACIVYLYYEMSKLGADLNKKVLGLTDVIKRINRNTNVVDMQLKRHLINHKTDIDVEKDQLLKDYLSENNNSEVINILELKLKELEKRLEKIEGTMNPIYDVKKGSDEYDTVTDKRQYKGDETQPLY